MSRITMLSGLTLLVLLAPVLNAAERTVAVLCPPQQNELAAVQAVVEAELSSTPGVSVVDRQQVSRVLQEQKLSLSGLSDAQTAIRVGQLSGAAMLIFLEQFAEVVPLPNFGPPVGPAGNGEPAVGGVGCVIYDSATGVRLIDRAIVGATLEARSAEVRQAVLDGGEKIDSIHQATSRVVSIVAARNGDLPGSATGICESMSRVVERRLVTAKGIALLERRRLASREQESQLTNALDGQAATTAQVTIDLEFRRGAAGKGVDAIALIKWPDDRASPRVQAHADHLDVTLADRLSEQLLERLLDGAVPKSAPFDYRRESRRFFHEARIRESIQDFPNAIAAAEAAAMLDPDSATKRHSLGMLLLRQARIAMQAKFQTPDASRIAAIRPMVERVVDSIETELSRLDLEQPSEQIAPNVHQIALSISQVISMVQGLGQFGRYGAAIKVESEDLVVDTTSSLSRLLEQLLERMDAVATRDSAGITVTGGATNGLLAMTLSMPSSKLFPIERRLGFVSKQVEWVERSRAKFGDRRDACPWQAASYLQYFNRFCQLSEADRPRVKEYLEKFAAADDVACKLSARTALIMLENKGLQKASDQVRECCQRLRPVVNETFEDWDRLEATLIQSEAYRFTASLLVVHLQHVVTSFRGEQRLPLLVDIVTGLVKHHVFPAQIISELVEECLEAKDVDLRKKVHQLLHAARAEESKPAQPPVPPFGPDPSARAKIDEGIAKLEAKYPELRTGPPSGPQFDRQFLFQANADQPLASAVCFVHSDDKFMWVLHVDEMIPLPSGAIYKAGLTRIDSNTLTAESFGSTDLHAANQTTSRPQNWIVAAAFSPERVVFAGGNKTLWEIDLKSRKWREIPQFDELPGQDVTSLALSNQVVYVALERGVLAAIKLDNSPPEIIVSSQRIERLTPLDNRGAFSIPFMAVDTTRERLLFAAPEGGQDALASAALWSLSLTNHRVEKLHSLAQAASFYSARWNGDGRLVISGWDAATVFSEDFRRSLTVGLRNILPAPAKLRLAQTPPARGRTAVFLGSDLVSIDSDTGLLSYVDNEQGKTQIVTQEPIEKLKGPANQFWQLYPLNEKKLLLSDGLRLWLLTKRTIIE